MEKLIFFGLVIPILFFVLYLGTRAIMSGVSAKQANQAIKDENEIDEIMRNQTLIDLWVMN